MYNKTIKKVDGDISIALTGRQSNQCCGMSEVYSLGVSNTITEKDEEGYSHTKGYVNIEEVDKARIFYQILLILRRTLLDTNTVIISFSDAVGESWSSLGSYSRMKGYSLADFAKWYSIKPVAVVRSIKTENLLHSYIITRDDLQKLAATRHRFLEKEIGDSYTDTDLTNSKKEALKEAVKAGISELL